MKLILRWGAKHDKNARKRPDWPLSTFFESDKAKAEKRRLAARL
jgi:hypothetical protein